MLTSVWALTFIFCCMSWCLRLINEMILLTVNPELDASLLPCFGSEFKRSQHRWAFYFFTWINLHGHVSTSIFYHGFITVSGKAKVVLFSNPEMVHFVRKLNVDHMQQNCLLLVYVRKIDAMSQLSTPWAATKASIDEGFIFKTTGEAFCRLIPVHGSHCQKNKLGFTELVFAAQISNLFPKHAIPFHVIGCFFWFIWGKKEAKFQQIGAQYGIDGSPFLRRPRRVVLMQYGCAGLPVYSSAGRLSVEGHLGS